MPILMFDYLFHRHKNHYSNNLLNQLKQVVTFMAKPCAIKKKINNVLKKIIMELITCGFKQKKLKLLIL